MTLEVSPIPKLFHFVFGMRKQREPFHLVYYLCLESCIQVNKPDEVYFYYHFEPYGRYWDMIKNKLSLVKVDPVSTVSGFHYKDARIRKLCYAHHSDFIRLEKILERGGVYADIDTIFVNPLPSRLFCKDFVLGRENPVKCRETGEMKESLCNAFIMSASQSDFGRVWLQKVRTEFDGTWSNHSTILPQKLSEVHPEWIHIEPSRSFYAYMWTREDLRCLFEGFNEDFSGIYSIHLWAHLWWPRCRRDFSHFYAGRLTEKFIRTVDTTYNFVARPFLPPARRKFWTFVHLPF